MGKKGIIYLVLFTILVITNFYVVILGFQQYNRSLQAKKILKEIDKSLSLNNQFSHSSYPFVLGVEAKTELADSRVINLKRFFRKYNSPLYDQAGLIVKVSDKYSFDYRLLPAIAMQESSLCKKIPKDSYNCWGWGIYGSKITKFDSYGQAIITVAEGIKTHYIDKGLITPSKIMAKYTPSSNGSWAHGVTTFLKILE